MRFCGTSRLVSVWRKVLFALAQIMVYVHIAAVDDAVDPFKRKMMMLRTLKFLPVLALAIALSPVAAQARNASHPAQTSNLTVVQGGVTANSFPDSFGG